MNSNQTLLTDLYQLTMMQGYYKANKNATTQIAIFDLFFRQREGLDYAVFAGLHSIVEYIQNLQFDKSDIQYLESLGIFEKDFLDYLAHFKFSGSLYSVAEGEIVFANEPLLVIVAPIIQAQLIETALLNKVGYQTLVATKSARISFVAKEQSVIEFGVRRAHGYDAGVYGSRAAIIGGCSGTSNVQAGKNFGVKIYGTHSHSWVLSFDTELQAFETYANLYKDACLLLVDTYDTLQSGVPNAIKVFDQLVRNGHKPIGIRLDSGDLAYLSKKARQMLDEHGHTTAKIFASGDIDEFVIESLHIQGAKIDIWGVGGKLITGGNNPILGCVYKLAAIQESKSSKDSNFIPKMKYSDNVAKTTNPGHKEIYRLYDKDGIAIADLIALKNEQLPTPLTITHPTDRWKQLTLHNYTQRKLLQDIYINGELVYTFPTLQQTIQNTKNELSKFWDEYKRITAPHIYKVDMSDELYNLKQTMVQQNLKLKTEKLSY